MASDPYPKSRQLARGERRYRRKIASPKQWAALPEQLSDAEYAYVIGRLGEDGPRRLFGV